MLVSYKIGQPQVPWEVYKVNIWEDFLLMHFYNIIYTKDLLDFQQWIIIIANIMQM